MRIVVGVKRGAYLLLLYRFFFDPVIRPMRWLVLLPLLTLTFPFFFTIWGYDVCVCLAVIDYAVKIRVKPDNTGRYQQHLPVT